MTSTSDPGSSRAPSSLRQARIDLDAVRSNLSLLGDDYVVDLAGDAYGHGMTPIARAVLGAGATRFSVRGHGDEERLRHLAEGRAISMIAPDHSRDPGGLYGVSNDPELRPVMRVSAAVISTKRLVAGDPVSYGYTWRAPRDTTLALVGIGYSDGISRRASNTASAWLNGIRPIVGRIAMDVLSLDLGDDIAAPGDEVVMFGELWGSTEEWASRLSVPALSVTAGIGRRVHRVFVGGAS